MEIREIISSDEKKFNPRVELDNAHNTRIQDFRDSKKKDSPAEMVTLGKPNFGPSAMVFVAAGAPCV